MELSDQDHAPRSPNLEVHGNPSTRKVPSGGSLEPPLKQHQVRTTPSKYADLFISYCVRLCFIVQVVRLIPTPTMAPPTSSSLMESFVNSSRRAEILKNPRSPDRSANTASPMTLARALSATKLFTRLPHNTKSIPRVSSSRGFPQ